MSQTCKTCSHPEVKKINSQIRAFVTLRDIGSQFGMSYESVRRHIENCLGLTINAMIRDNKIQQAIDVHEEFRQQLAFAKKSRLAAEKWLTDPENPEQFTLAPRSNEIDVVYSISVDGKFITKTEPLDAILSLIHGEGFRSPTPFIKTVDLREYALKTLDRCDTAIDKFAKIAGVYQQDRLNEQDATKAIQLELDKFVKYCESKPELSPRQILAELRENTPMNPVYAMLLSAQVEVMESGSSDN